VQKHGPKRPLGATDRLPYENGEVMITKVRDRMGTPAQPDAERRSAAGDAASAGGLADEGGPSRRVRVLFSLLHTGYLRHYGEPIRLLAARGHTVHIALSRPEKDAGDDRLVEQLAAEFPTVTYGLTPKRGDFDGWSRLAWMVRALTDLARYGDPRYAQATALKERIARRIRLRLREGQLDPLTRSVTRRFFERALEIDQARSRKFIRVLGRIERAIPPSRELKRYIRKFRPDVVLASPVVEIASEQVDVLKAARRVGVATGVCIASWDNLTNKGLIRFLPDRVFVWNEIQRTEATEMHGIPPDRVVITGAQKLDKWFGRSPTTSRDEFMRMVGLDPRRPFVLYLCSSLFIAATEAQFVERWLKAIRESGLPLLADAGVLIRPHPQNARQWADVDLSTLGQAAVWPRGGEHPDAGAASAAFFDSLYHSSAVVGVNTTALIEAGVVGRPVHTVLAPEFAATQEGTLHFHYLRWENGGLLHVAEDLDEHLRQLAEALAGSADSEQVRRFVERFCRPQGMETPSAPLVAARIEQLALERPKRAARVDIVPLVLRAILYPWALATTATAALSVATRWARYVLLKRLRRRVRWLLMAVKARL
jgi:hypothetical protein